MGNTIDYATPPRPPPPKLRAFGRIAFAATVGFVALVHEHTLARLVGAEALCPPPWGEGLLVMCLVAGFGFGALALSQPETRTRLAAAALLICLAYFTTCVGSAALFGGPFH